MRNMGNAPPFILKLASILGMNQISTDISPCPPPNIVILPCTVATSGFENLMTLMPWLDTCFQRRSTLLSAGEINLLEMQFLEDELNAIKAVKDALDPEWALNPGVMF